MVNKILDEASLNRIRSHLNDNEICFISVNRNENTPEENNKLTKQLEIDIKKLGYGFIDIKGAYIETDINSGEKKQVIEKSFFVINTNFKGTKKFSNEMFTLAKKYNQETILLKDSLHPAAWYAPDGTQISAEKTKLTTKDLESGYSSFKGHTFSLIEAVFDYENFNTEKRGFGLAIEGILLRKALGLKDIT